MKIRAATIADLPFLREMLAEASNREFGPPFDEPVRHRRHRRYVEGWGRRGDTALIAEEEGKRIGAAWYRLFSKDEPGTGFIDESIPEVAIAVIAERRGKGAGSALLAALVERARKTGSKRSHSASALQSRSSPLPALRLRPDSALGRAALDDAPRLALVQPFRTPTKHLSNSVLAREDSERRGR